MLFSMAKRATKDPAGRGRTATKPLRIPLRGWMDILFRVASRIMPSQIGLIAAGVAFYTLLAVFPAIAALMALAGLVTDPSNVVDQLQTVTELLPDQAALIVLNQAQMVAGTPDSGLSVTLALGIAFAVYLSTRGTTSLIHGLNIAYEETEKRGFFQFWGVVLILTVAILLGALLLVLLLIGVPAALALLPMDFETANLIGAIRWAAIAIVVVLGLGGLYRWGPSRKSAKWIWLTPGAAVAGLLWFAGSYAFTLYVTNFGNYNQTFGSLGGVIVLLTWLWLSAYMVLLGALLDAEIEAQTGEDSTIGPDRPMGQREAFKADHLGETPREWLSRDRPDSGPGTLSEEHR